MEILAIIPARSGSKSVKNKNIRLMNGRPMLAYSIEHALQCPLINRVVVSTDSEEYARIALENGAEVPFIRPAEIAGDKSLDIEVFEHALKFLKENEQYEPDIVVQLRPTYPIRRVEDIVNCIRLLIENPEADSVRCIAPAKEVAYKMWRKDERGRLTPILTDVPEAYNMPRQELPKIYYQNACIDVCRASVIMEKHSMSGDEILGYQMEHNFDIDTEEEFHHAEEYLKQKELASFFEGKRFVFDIDGVIAQIHPTMQYNLANPNQEIIEIINALYDNGNYIVLFTARGYATGINWEEVTQKQMADWGVKYHELIFGKPNADYYVDDRMLSLQELKKKYVDYKNSERLR